jgi:hypothetical protein
MATGRIPTTANSPLTVKGDLFGYSTTQARVPVGNDGETLVADSSTSTGLRYNPTSEAGKNGVINGGYDVWARGTSVSVSASSAPYTTDRWQANVGANQATTVSRQATGDTTNLPNIQYCARFQRNSGQTGTGSTYFTQSLESVNSIPFAGKAVTVSFYARRGSNYSATSNALTAILASGTGTDQNINTGFTGQATTATSTVTLTTTWQRFTMTGTVASTATQLGVYFTFTPTGTASTNDYYEITGVQVELGSVATTFSRAGGTIQGELAACQRYFQLTEFVSLCHARATTSIEGSIMFPVTMRVAPTLTAISAWQFYDAFGNGFTQSSANGTLAVSGANTKGAFVSLGNFTGLTQGRTYAANAAGQGSFSLSSEL